MYIKYVNLFFYKERSLLHVSATNCGYIHLPEDGQNRWPKHVEGYAFYNTINLKFLYALFGIVSQNGSSLQGHEIIKIDVVKLRIEARINFF